MVLLPLVIVMMTSFVKIAVVLSLVRNALGTQQIPPNQVITGLAIILTVYIMVPVGIECYRSAEGAIQQTTNHGSCRRRPWPWRKTHWPTGKSP
ncbi:MAG: hypothetical protein U1F57_02685 [bacterium]